MFSFWFDLNKAFSVKTIMTPRDHWVTVDLVQSDFPISQFDLGELKFDLVPVNENGRVDSFIEKENPIKIHEITKEWLVSSDTNIPDLIDIFIQSKKSTLFVINNQDLIGLVTPADLNKLQTRTYIYVLIGHLEIYLLSFIKSMVDFSDNEILRCITEPRKEEILRMQKSDEQNNLNLDLFNYLQFYELFTIVERTPILLQKLNFPSKASFAKATKGITHLRNDTMHCSKSIIPSKSDGLVLLNERLDKIKNLLDRIP